MAFNSGLFYIRANPRTVDLLTRIAGEVCFSCVVAAKLVFAMQQVAALRVFCLKGQAVLLADVFKCWANELACRQAEQAQGMGSERLERVYLLPFSWRL